MSFENVFETWLRKKDIANIEETKPTTNQPAHGADDASDGNRTFSERTPENPCAAWHHNEQGTLLLPSEDDLSPVDNIRKSRSPPLPPQTHSSILCDELEAKGTFCNHSSDLLHRQKPMNILVQGYESNFELEKPHGGVGEASVNEYNRTVTCHHCQSQLPVKELTKLTQLSGSHTLCASPQTSRKGLEMDQLLSPERELPMEPDSTSEVMAGFIRFRKSGKQCGASLQDLSPQVIRSPRRLTCTGSTALCTQSSGTCVQGEESQAECDSTSLLLTSPCTISPASQGEIEERVCPILTDREDGASPAHCVCQCRALRPRGGVVSRDHLLITPKASPTSTASQQLSANTDNSAAVASVSLLGSKPFIHHGSLVSDLDHSSTASSCVHRSKAIDGVLKIEGNSAHVMHAKKQEDLDCDKHKDSRDDCRTGCVSRNKPVCNAKDERSLIKYTSNLLPSGMDDYDAVTNVRHCAKMGPGRLTFSGHEVGRKNVKKQLDMPDFTEDIDWGSAVAETVESPSSMVECDGESKPGIILKIRRKAIVQNPDPSPEPFAQLRPKRAAVLKRKGSSVDNSEIISRLRKRQKSGETEKPKDQEIPEVSLQQKQTESRLEISDPPGTSDRGRRCNTGQFGSNLKVDTEHLDKRVHRFVEHSAKLFRMQTEMYKLVCTLFPLLRPHLSHVSPASHHFTKIIDDIIGSLQHSDTEELVQNCEDLCGPMEDLRIEACDVVPVFSPQIVLCSSPRHSLEEFQDKVYTLLQLLLPDITVSFSDTLSRTSDQLEIILKRVTAANIKESNVKRNQYTRLNEKHLYSSSFFH